jgi:hypothetical protein
MADEARGSSGTKSHYIPFRKADIVKMCLAEESLSDEQQESFEELTKILSALLHYEYHDRLETLVNTYAPLSPDEADNRIVEPSREERLTAETEFLAMLREVLVGANARELTREEIEHSISADPRLGMRLEVDLDEFEELHIFRRDEHTELVERRSLFGLRKQAYEQAFYDRVVVYLRFKDDDAIPERRRKSRALQQGRPGQVYLKLFSHVPTDGLEMLFPNARMRMRPKDKLFIGVPAAAGGVIMLANKLLPTILLVGALLAFWLGLRREEVRLDQKQLVGLGLGLVALGAFLWKQFGKIKARRMEYLRTLSENLYFRVFDNNAGVLHHLIGAAEDEDFKESILAYYFLLTREDPMTEEELDHEIERWFETEHGCHMDFEVDDAARKLERMGLAERDGEGRLSVTSLDESKRRLDWLWDNFFSYSNGESENPK